MKLTGKCAIITGASQGFGFEVAKQFVLQGANVMLCARNSKPLYLAQKALIQLANDPNKVLAQPTDVSKLDQVDALVETAISAFGSIHALVANAGVYGTKGPLDEIDWEEWSQAIDINLKGTVIQCKAMIPHFKLNQRGKIIILSGGGATKPMPNLSAYAASKAAVVRFAETLAEEVKESGIEVNTVAPGALNTRFLEEVLEAGPEKVGTNFYQQALSQKQKGGVPLTLGASLCVFLASHESNGITGKLISAVWDPWKSFAEYKEELKNSDIYTLRRIVPEDRGKNWE